MTDTAPLLHSAAKDVTELTAEELLDELQLQTLNILGGGGYDKEAPGGVQRYLAVRAEAFSRLQAYALEAGLE